MRSLGRAVFLPMPNDRTDFLVLFGVVLVDFLADLAEVLDAFAAARARGISDLSSLF